MMDKRIQKYCGTCEKCDGSHCVIPGRNFNGQEILPSAAYLLLTENCNLRCKYCFEGNSRNIKKIMSEEVAFKTVDYLFENALMNTEVKKIDITFFGGEPMLNPKLAEKVIEYTEDKVKDTEIVSNYSLITNGTVYNEDVEHFLETWYSFKKDKMSVQLSYDGGPDIQCEGRPCADPNMKSSDLVEATCAKYIEFFEKHNINTRNITIHSVVTKKSIGQLMDSYMYFTRKLQIKNSHFAWLMEDDWDDEDVKIFDRELNKIVSHLSNISNNLSRFPFKSFNGCSGCSSGKQLMCVDCDGNIYPCHRFFFYDADRRDNYLIGNISNEHEEVIDIEKVDRFRKFNCATSYDEPCQICIACNEYYTNDLGTMPNNYQIEFMKIINSCKDRFSSIVERKNLIESNRLLAERVTNLENLIFSLAEKVDNDN